MNNHIHDGCPGWANDWQAHWNVTDPVSLANLEAQRERGHWCARCIIKTPEFQAELAAAGLSSAVAA